MHHPDQPRSRSWIARIPLPWISILVSLFCGLIAWVIIDPIQSQELHRLFHSEFENRLESRAVDTRRRFEHSLLDMEKGAFDLAQNWYLVNYVYSDTWQESAELTLNYYHEHTPWLAPEYALLGSIEPSHIILLDPRGHPREVYHHQDQPFPVDLAVDLYNDQFKGIITTIWQSPYFITWAKVARGGEMAQAVVMLIVPLDEQFLVASQQFAGLDGLVIGLFDGDQQTLLVSSDRAQVGPPTKLGDWQDEFLITSQAFTRYQSPDRNIQFFTLMSRARMETRLGNILDSVRRERIFEAFVYLIAFALAFFLISSRLNQILRRITQFAHNALGVEQSASYFRGNQLYVLESNLLDLFQQVSHARDESKVEQELRIRESEALKSALLDNSLDPIITVDNRGLIIEANITAETTFGYSREQMLGTPLDQLVIQPKDRLLMRQMLSYCRQHVGSGPMCRSQRMLGLDAQGKEKPLECSVMSISLKDRVVFTVYLRDITETEKAHRQIQSLAKFASENPSPVIRINSRGVIMYANIASEPLLRYWGCEQGQTLPLYWRNLVFKSLQDGINREYELNLDEQIVSLLMAPVLELDYVNLYGRDITQVRIAEQQSRQHQSELVHVCRVSTMGEMATGLAHELNQPLAAIVNFASGCVRRLQSGIGGEAELVDAMVQITAQAERAGEIIKRLRALVGKRPHEHALVNLNNLVLETASFIEYIADKNLVDVNLHLHPGPLPVQVDLVQIEQVLLNLIRNGIDAMQQVEPDRRKLELITRRCSDDQVEVIVRDTGPGMAQETIDHLFDAFFSTKEDGMGMGLPISRKIIETHKGHISASSELGKGAEFRVVLPSDPNLKLAGY
jgi:PAS domain S-box-containing protein